MPVIAAFVAFLNAAVVNLLTLAIIINICAQGDVSTTLLSFIAFSQCCMVGTWAVNEIPIGNHLKTPIPTLEITNRRRNLVKKREPKMQFCRCVYKSYRIFYATVWFYWTPFLALILPSVALLLSQRSMDSYNTGTSNKTLIGYFKTLRTGHVFTISYAEIDSPL